MADDTLKIVAATLAAAQTHTIDVKHHDLTQSQIAIYRHVLEELRKEEAAEAEHASAASTETWAKLGEDG